MINPQLGLEEHDIRKLKLALDDACKKSGKNMKEMIKEVEGIVSSHLSHGVYASNVAEGVGHSS